MEKTIVATSIIGILGIIAIELYAISKNIDGIALSISVGSISSIITLLIRSLIAKFINAKKLENEKENEKVV